MVGNGKLPGINTQVKMNLQYQIQVHQKRHILLNPTFTVLSLMNLKRVSNLELEIKS